MHSISLMAKGSSNRKLYEKDSVRIVQIPQSMQCIITEILACDREQQVIQ